jgi:ATP-dependent helicase/nuclease subunit B
VLAAGSAVVEARRSGRFTRFDGNLSGLAVPSPAEHVTSATRLERWAACPFAYLMQDVFGVPTVTNPETELSMAPLVRGELVHRALEQFIGDRIGSAPDPDLRWSADDRDRLAAIGDALCDEYERRGLTGKPVFWRRERIHLLEDLQRFLDHDDAYRSQFHVRPVAAELAFGLPGANLDPVVVTLPDGRAVRFRGKADRVDEAADGSLRVIDYKTGKRDQYNSLTEDNPDAGGQLLQLPVYGAAARALRDRPDAAVDADYWFVSPGPRPWIGFPVTATVMARFGETLQGIVSGIEAGTFPNHPVAASTSPKWKCQYCDPDRLGVTELRAGWDRKRADPALARYADRVEPDGAASDA